MAEGTAVTALRKASGWSIALAVLMIIAGLIAMVEPGFSGLVITLVIGWSAILA